MPMPNNMPIAQIKQAGEQAEDFSFDISFASETQYLGHPGNHQYGPNGDGEQGGREKWQHHRQPGRSKQQGCGDPAQGGRSGNC